MHFFKSLIILAATPLGFASAQSFGTTHPVLECGGNTDIRDIAITECMRTYKVKSLKIREAATCLFYAESPTCDGAVVIAQVAVGCHPLTEWKTSGSFQCIPPMGDLK